jgi:hypothetical protein
MSYEKVRFIGYGAHTQLAGIATAPRGANAPLSGSADAEFHPAPDVDVVVLPVTPGSDFDECFAGGPGAVHTYGAARPLPLCNPAGTVG